MRIISDCFIADLKNPDGILCPILKKIKRDKTLMLAIRENNINIYYRGGNILKLYETRNGGYKASFDEKYNIYKQNIPVSPIQISSQVDSNDWVNSFPMRKNIMDEYFSRYGKSEREFQQLVVRENNDSTISKESEYFITDIEQTTDEISARFDLAAIRWLSTQRKYGNRCKPVLMEMKYGDKAIEGDASISKHLKDLEAFISNGGLYSNFLKTTESQFNQLDDLGLLRFNKGISNARVILDEKEKPEVVFILANHNPRSTKLHSILKESEVDCYAKSELFDLRFFVASFAGYGLHADCMLTLEEFKKLLKQ